jgi:sortase A
VRRSNNRSMRRNLPKVKARLDRWAQRLPESVADRALILGTLIAIVMVGASTVAVMRTEPSYADAFDAPTLVQVEAPQTPTTATTVAPAPEAPVEPVSRPIAPPADPRAKTPIVQIGEIRIPKIGLVHTVYEGVTLTVIDHGPGHWPGSAIPGQRGNMVFAGHRVTHSHPFRNIDKLVPGDEVIFRDKDGEWLYRVTGQEIVKPSDVHIVNPTPDATMTLFACHPPGRAIQRIVVRGVFVSKTA